MSLEIILSIFLIKTLCEAIVFDEMNPIIHKKIVIKK